MAPARSRKRSSPRRSHVTVAKPRGVLHPRVQPEKGAGKGVGRIFTIDGGGTTG
jgi:hypothetical protein